MNPRDLRVRVIVFLAGLWFVVGTEIARAEPSAMDRATAEALFDQALSLMDAGKVTEACPKLEESQRLDPGVGTLLYLADCYEKLGRTASAWATFTEAAYAAKAAGQADREGIALENAARLEPSLSRLVIQVAATATGLEVARDGKPVASAMWGADMPVDPGRQTVTASAPGKQTWSGTVDVPAAGKAQLTVPELLDEPAAPPVVAPPEPEGIRSASPETRSDDARRDRDPGATQRLWGWVGIVAGGAALGGGGLFALLAVADDGRANDACRRDDPTLCSERGVDLGDAAHTKATVATVLGGVGGAALVTGVVLLLSAPEAGDTAWSIAPALGPSAGGVLLEGAF